MVQEKERIFAPVYFTFHLLGLGSTLTRVEIKVELSVSDYSMASQKYFSGGLLFYLLDLLVSRNKDIL